MAHDPWGNIVSGADPIAQTAVDRFAAALVGYTTDAGSIVAAADADVSHPLVQAYAGMLHLLAEAQGAERNARPFLARAEAAANDADPRERLLIVALAAWIAGDIDRTIIIFTQVLANHPGDLITLKLLHYHLFNRGDFAALLRTALAAAAAAPEIGPVHGMVAFGYEQLHLLDHAEQAARRALDLEPHDPWAQHALAHVMLTQGRIDEGIAFLEERQAQWRGLNSFMVTHLWWHLALFYLSAGREQDALAAYDAQVWAVAKDYSQDQIGAVSLLTQLELADVDIGSRWQELGGYLSTRADDVVQPFLTVQYLYGLARAGKPQANQLLAAIAAVAADPARQDRAIWQDAALPLAQGLVEHARGNYARSADLIGEALPRLLGLGGSHAQRDLFDQLQLDALARSGRLREAQQKLELRRAHDPHGVPLNRRLAAVYRGLELDDLAAEADARVAQRLTP